MSYSLPINSNSKVTFLFVQDQFGNWVPARSGDFSSDKFAVKLTGDQTISGEKTFKGFSTFDAPAIFNQSITFNGFTTFAADEVQFYGNVFASEGHFSSVVAGPGTFADNVTAFTLDVESQITANGGTLVLDQDQGDQRWVQATGNWFTVKSESTNARNLNISDAGAQIRSTVAVQALYTIPPQSSVPWYAGTEIIFNQNGPGKVVVTGGAGVTVNTSETNRTSKQFAYMALKRVAQNIWDLTGERELA